MKLNCVIAGLVLSVATAGASAGTFKEAEAAVVAARDAGFPWTTTLSLLKKAKKADANNDQKNLDKFVAAIMKETSEAMFQAEQAKKAGPRF
jgi:hypothetical protein